MAEMRILSTEGVVEAEVADSGDQSRVIAHWHAVYLVLEGNLDQIEQYHGLVIVGEIEEDRNDTVPRAFALETDPDTITRWAKQGDLDFDDPYAD